MFVGQAVASVSTVCEMPHMSNNPLQLSAKMTHADMLNISDDATEHSSMKMDCCDTTHSSNKECSCPINACNVNSMLSVNTLMITSAPMSEKVYTTTLQHAFRFGHSLYRPPMAV